jgi:Tfp pilus assembly protein PilN
MIQKIEINLLPAEYRVRKRGINLSRSIVYPVLVLILLAAGAGFYTIHLNDKQARLSEEIAAIEKEIEANKSVQEEINKLRHEKQVTDQKIRALERISVDRERWVRLLEIFSGSLPPYSWLISVKEEKGPPEALLVEARTYSFPEVADYMNRLEKTDYIKSVELTPAGIEQIQGHDRKVYKFNITCEINVEVGMRPAAESDTLVREAGGEAKPAGRRRRGAAGDGGAK